MTHRQDKLTDHQALAEFRERMSAMAASYRTAICFLAADRVAQELEAPAPLTSLHTRRTSHNLVIRAYRACLRHFASMAPPPQSRAVSPWPQSASKITPIIVEHSSDASTFQTVPEIPLPPLKRKENSANE
jgi:hypothetical protein